MVISSLVIEAIPDQVDSVAAELAKIDNVEVHSTQDYKVVVLVEAETVDASHAIASSFINIEGVTGINLVYTNFEDDPDIIEAVSQ
ncbi:MAG: chaperone NapD [Coriobacteriia bacterium]|jgi:nitrate reductase NapD|nr:chaperone NapD [Coriobacteriia bacterium]MDR2714027.1 chaperone NapD [Coriobacteriales bacterium]